MAEPKFGPAFLKQYREAGCEMELTYITAKEVQSFSGFTKETDTIPRKPDEADAALEVRAARNRYDPDVLGDDILEETGIAPEIGGFVLFFTFVVASLGGAILATTLALFCGFAFLPTLAVYYVMTNALILGTVVIFALVSADYEEDTD